MSYRLEANRANNTAWGYIKSCHSPEIIAMIMLN